jgi:Neurotransmitter-gated ion-channel ligand binding domain
VRAADDLQNPRTMLRGAALVCCLSLCLLEAPGAARADASLLGPPDAEGPVVVSVGLFVSDVNEIDERRETFEFEGILTVKWRDSRQSFDPGQLGAAERVYQGDFQFSEVYDGWWPQLILVNESGGFEQQAVMLRIAPDGSCTLIQEIHAVAEMPMALRRFPFDHQDFDAVFEVLGFRRDRVVLSPDTARTGHAETGVNIAQWEVRNLRASVRDFRPIYGDGNHDDISQFVATLEMARRPAHMLQVVVLPLMLLVILTFSVFWMDRESLGDRMDISFVGILTVVAYQIIVSDAMPGIAYFTLMTGFLYSTYLVLAAGVVVNLVVSRLDRTGRRESGDQLDRVCRWAVPSAFFGANALSAAYFLTFH